MHLFVRDSKELNHYFKQAASALKPDGMLWCSYPKKSSGVDTDLTRDAGWSAVMSAGWKPIRQIKIDDVWAASRFKLEEDKTEGDLLAEQYKSAKAAKAALLPIYHKVVAIVNGFGDDVAVEARKSYVNFVRGTTFAAIVPATRDRIDLHFRLKGDPVEPPFAASKIGGSVTHMLSVSTLEDVDEEITRLLHTAYERNEGKSRPSMGG